MIDIMAAMAFPFLFWAVGFASGCIFVYCVREPHPSRHAEHSHLPVPRPADAKGHQPKYPVGHNPPPKTPKSRVNAQGLPTPRPPDKKGNQPTIPANPYPPRKTPKPSAVIQIDAPLSDADIERIGRAMATRLMEPTTTGPSLLDGIRDRAAQP